MTVTYVFKDDARSAVTQLPQLPAKRFNILFAESSAIQGDTYPIKITKCSEKLSISKY